ncbi:MAG TPA: threonine synthase [Candidatus Methylomirabilis sp.]
MGRVVELRCVTCNRAYAPGPARYVCDACGPLRGTLEVRYDYEGLRRRLSREGFAASGHAGHWRYVDLLPVPAPGPAGALRVGWTPLYEAPRLRAHLKMPRLFVKDDGLNPSASFKDRASSVGVARALEVGATAVTAASTGNAAASLATLASSVGLPAYIFVPRGAPRGKLAQLLMHGATIFEVNANYDTAFDLCLEASARFGWYSRNTAYNPYLGEGKKTAALEVCEQLGWAPPDRVFVSVGDGCIFSGLWKGFRDLVAVGLADRTPRLLGVQAAGAAPLVKAFAEGKAEAEPMEPKTRADSISVGVPRDQVKALRAARESGGTFVAVSDEEIFAAQRLLARQGGVFGEPAGVAGLAGLLKMLEAGQVGRDETVVVLVTGHGLKDVDAALAAAQGTLHPVEPTLAAVERILRADGS